MVLGKFQMQWAQRQRSALRSVVKSAVGQADRTREDQRNTKKTPESHAVSPRNPGTQHAGDCRI